MKRFEKVKQVLEEAVEGKTILAHGNFWRDLTIDQFKVKKIYGKQLVEVGNAEGSNIVRALEGRAPFGANVGTPGAVFNKMPDGFPAVAPEKIDIIRKWIDDGCPDAEDTSEGTLESREQQLTRYNAYWRDFDNWSLFNRTPEIDDALNEFFAVAEMWMAAARQEIPASDWKSAISTQPVRNAVSLLGSRILATMQAHYGTPTNLSELLESYELFGANKLPDDALRPDDIRHNMNGAMMWFFYSAFLDASLELNSPPETTEMIKLGRAILVGLVNDGLFRQRFRVTGFTADDEGAEAVRAFVAAVPESELRGELVRRYVESQDVTPAFDAKIVELMGVPSEEHNIDWLKNSLQAALKLELSTIPPYLCALWSIIEPDPQVESYAYKSIRNIVVDEKPV